jgi:hypothetical protein
MATTLSQAGSIEEAMNNVLNSPLYSQQLQDYYLSTYAPGLTQATYGINAARNAFQANENTRTQQRGEAVRRIAGDYASRGMRTPGAINRDRSKVQDQFANLSREEQNRIMQMENERDVLYGAQGQAQSGETFMNTPAAFGSIGQGARQSALSGLQGLPGFYGLLGVGPSTAPMAEAPMQAEAPAPQPVTIASLLPQAQAPAPAAAAPAPVSAAKPAAARRTGVRTQGAGMNRMYAI